MDYQSYAVTVPFPDRDAFKTRYWYREGHLVAKQGPDEPAPTFAVDAPKVPLDSCVREVILDEDAYLAAKRDYGQAHSAADLRFKLDLFKELGIETNPKRDLLFQKAWDRGHSSGLAEVHTCAMDLVELIENDSPTTASGRELAWWIIRESHDNSGCSLMVSSGPFNDRNAASSALDTMCVRHGWVDDEHNFHPVSP